MDKQHAIILWNASIYRSSGVDVDGSECGNHTAFGGAALANSLTYLCHSKAEGLRADHKVAAEFLREWADALEEE